MTKPDIKLTREQRLAAKLKENLRRRKAQSRARAQDSGANDAEKTDAVPPKDKSNPQS